MVVPYHRDCWRIESQTWKPSALFLETHSKTSTHLSNLLCHCPKCHRWGMAASRLKLMLPSSELERVSFQCSLRSAWRTANKDPSIDLSLWDHWSQAWFSEPSCHLFRDRHIIWLFFAVPSPQTQDYPNISRINHQYRDASVTLLPVFCSFPTLWFSSDCINLSRFFYSLPWFQIWEELGEQLIPALCIEFQIWRP
jgi:hypothetical protein